MLNPLEITLLALLGLLWGMPYALTKITLATIPPLTSVAARVALAAAVLWIIVIFMGCKIPARRDFVGRVFIQGCIGCAIPYGLIAIAQQSVDSALAAILNSTTPIFVFLISLAWTRHEPLTAGRIFGVTTGLGGVVLIAGASALLGLGEAAAGQTAIIVATISSAVGAIYSRRFAAVAPQVTVRAICSIDRRLARQCCHGNRAWFRGIFSSDPDDRQHGRGKRQLSQACHGRADRVHVAGRDAHLDGRPWPLCNPDRRRRDQFEGLRQVAAFGPIATDIDSRCGEERPGSNARLIPDLP
jgi:hypothetical protein